MELQPMVCLVCPSALDPNRSNRRSSLCAKCEIEAQRFVDEPNGGMDVPDSVEEPMQTPPRASVETSSRKCAVCDAIFTLSHRTSPPHSVLCKDCELVSQVAAEGQEDFGLEESTESLSHPNPIDITNTTTWTGITDSTPDRSRIGDDGRHAFAIAWSSSLSSMPLRRPSLHNLSLNVGIFLPNPPTMESAHRNDVDVVTTSQTSVESGTSRTFGDSTSVSSWRSGDSTSDRQRALNCLVLPSSFHERQQGPSIEPVNSIMEVRHPIANDTSGFRQGNEAHTIARISQQLQTETEPNERIQESQQDDNSTIMEVETRSPDDLINQRYLDAEKNGNIIAVDDDDDDKSNLDGFEADVNADDVSIMEVREQSAVELIHQRYLEAERNGRICNTCPDFDLCEECYKDPQTNRGTCTHELSPIAVEPDSSQERNGLTEAERKQRQRNLMMHIQLIEHASACVSNACQSSNCAKMKNYLHHAGVCRVKVQGGCKICKRIWTLLRVHAQKCKKPKCPIPHCIAIREKMRQLQKQQQAMDDRRRLEMNRHMRFSVTGDGGH